MNFDNILIYKFRHAVFALSEICEALLIKYTALSIKYAAL